MLTITQIRWQVNYPANETLWSVALQLTPSWPLTALEQLSTITIYLKQEKLTSKCNCLQYVNIEIRFLYTTVTWNFRCCHYISSALLCTRYSLFVEIMIWKALYCNVNFQVTRYDLIRVKKMYMICELIMKSNVKIFCCVSDNSFEI